MSELPRKPFHQAAQNPWERLAAAGSANPLSLTQQFNAAAKKPVLKNNASVSSAKAAELLRLMRETGRSMTHTTAPRPASVMQIEALKKKLSQPRLTLDRTPVGTVTNSYDPHRDRKLMQTIRLMQAQLKSHQGKAKTDFNRAAGLGM